MEGFGSPSALQASLAVLSAGTDTVLMCGSAIFGLARTSGVPGTGGSKGVGVQRGLVLCESGIELAPGFFQSVGSRLRFVSTVTGLPLWSTTLGFSLDDAVVADTVSRAAVGALPVADFVVGGEVCADMLIVELA